MSDPTAGSLRQQLAQHVDKLPLEQSLRAPVAVESQWLAVMETAQGRRSPGTAPVNQPADAPCRLPMKPASAMFMPLTSFPAGPLAKALACTTLLLSLSLSACSSHPGPAVEGRRTLQVLSTSPAQLLENPESGGRQFPPACQAWQLSHAQVAQFFLLASEYPQLQHQGFDYLPCEISGELVADGQHWQYRINAAGTARWTRAGQQRYFACDAPGCAPLVLMLPDHGEP